MAAMMPSGGGGSQSANPYEHYDAPTVEDDLIDPDDGTRISTASAAVFQTLKYTASHSRRAR